MSGPTEPELRKRRHQNTFTEGDSPLWLPLRKLRYQASKLLPPARALLEPGGVVIMVAECTDGTGPLERVNEGIYALGIRDKLPAHRVVLVSELAEATVAKTYAEYAPSLRVALEDALRRHPTSGPAGRGRIPLLWRAGEAVTEPCSAATPVDAPTAAEIG